MKKLRILLVAGAATMLSSCDLTQIPGLDGKLSLEDSKAVGAACRHSGRALEDCFAMNPKTHPSGVFDGWRDMNDYMLANQIEVVKPEIRTSAFKQEKDPIDDVEEGHAAAPAKQGADPSTADAAPPVQGRQRWSPKAGGSQAAAGTSSSTPPASTPPVAAVPPAASEPVTKKDEPTSAQAPSAPAPARPWERKKEAKQDPKKHT